MCNLHIKIIKETKYLPRKFVMERKIKFTGNDELDMDCGGLRVESLEWFNNHWLSIVAERHPTLFIKKTTCALLLVISRRLIRRRSWYPDL